MFQGIYSMESAKIVSLVVKPNVPMMGRPRRNSTLWSWFPSIYGGPLESNLQEGKYTLCLSWMGDRHTSMVLTSLINLTPPLSRLLMLFRLRPNHCQDIRFTGFTLIGHTIRLLGGIIVKAMVSFTNLLLLTLLLKTDSLSMQSIQQWRMYAPYFMTLVWAIPLGRGCVILGRYPKSYSFT